jgi:hypothetical protein
LTSYTWTSSTPKARARFAGDRGAATTVTRPHSIRTREARNVGDRSAMDRELQAA